MSATSRSLPNNPHLDAPKRLAKDLLSASKSIDKEAIGRIQRSHPVFHHTSPERIAAEIKLSDAQLIIAREYGFSSWTKLKERIVLQT